MAIQKAKAQQTSSVARVSEGADTYVRTLRDGALLAANWKLACIMEGRGFTTIVGALSTPVAGGDASFIVDIDKPSFLVSVPTGISIIPIYTRVAVGLPVGAADDDEIDILIAVDQDKAWDATGTATAATIYNMNTLNSRASGCTGRKTFTATTTDPVLDLELAHYTKVFELYSTAGTAGNAWTDAGLVYEPVAPPILNGPCMYIVYWGGTVATQAFMTAQWLEFPTTYFS